MDRFILKRTLPRRLSSCRRRGRKLANDERRNRRPLLEKYSKQEYARKPAIDAIVIVPEHFIEYNDSVGIKDAPKAKPKLVEKLQMGLCMLLLHRQEQLLPWRSRNACIRSGRTKADWRRCRCSTRKRARGGIERGNSAERYGVGRFPLRLVSHLTCTSRRYNQTMDALI